MGGSRASCLHLGNALRPSIVSSLDWAAPAARFFWDMRFRIHHLLGVIPAKAGTHFTARAN